MTQLLETHPVPPEDLLNEKGLRLLLRDHMPSQIVLCALLGVVVGLITYALHKLVLYTHEIGFHLPLEGRLSAAEDISAAYILRVPVLAGLLLGGLLFLFRRLKMTEVVDPIEANAIFGGRMSIWTSLQLMLLTVVSNGAGASIGMEAAYTQGGAGFFSSVGQYLRLRRQDLRVFVAAGAAAAIAAAFNAPMAGAFYGFELVLGTYTISALSQVSAAALAGDITVRFLTGSGPIFALPLDDLLIPGRNYVLFVALGVMAAGVGILTMKCVTYCEQLAKKLPVPYWLTPVVGGMILSLIALVFPNVLGSGQGAIADYLHDHGAFLMLLALLAAKIVASAVSIGSGFKGGLFSSSLLIGCFLGQAVGVIANVVFPDTAGQVTSFTLVGMGAVAASIIGAPVTMIMLVLEMTGSFNVTTGVITGVLVSSAITRYYFGYSFSTWRFHIRGLPIWGAQDVGWIGEIRVGSMMGADLKVVPDGMPLAEIKAQFPPGSAKTLFVTDDTGNYTGMIDVAVLHKPNTKEEDVFARDLAKNGELFLLKDNNIKQAMEVFDKQQVEELPVVDSAAAPRLVGRITESFCLRRYARELEARDIVK